MSQNVNSKDYEKYERVIEELEDDLILHHVTFLQQSKLTNYFKPDAT